MRYALLLYHQPGWMDELDPAEMEAAGKEFYALHDDPACVDGSALMPTTAATTLRESGGRALVTDGPFADTKEILGGYYIIDVPDLDAASAFAERVPLLRHGGAVEIRPLLVMAAAGAHAAESTA
jgi:hypothetical protein